MFLDREGFTKSCLDFQRNIEKGENDVLRDLLSEKEFLETKLHLLGKKDNALQNSMLAFMEEILEDLHGSNSGNVGFSFFVQKGIGRHEVVVLVR